MSKPTQKGELNYMKKKKMKAIYCPYCGCRAVLQKATAVYKEHALEEYLYVCSNYPKCDSYVGVHKGTILPKGSLANRNLRHKRILAHRYFDSIWKNGIMSKKNAYRWMQDIFCFNSEQAHIGQYSDYMCEQIIAESKKVLETHKIAC